MARVPVWSDAGIICTGETYKAVVKLTFAKGASLADPSGLFNSSLEGNTRRAIVRKSACHSAQGSRAHCNCTGNRAMWRLDARDGIAPRGRES